MKKYYLIFILCISFIFQSQFVLSQQHTFSEVLYDTTNGVNNIYSIVPAFDNGYMIAGQTNYYRGLLLKIDTSGNLIWAKQYGPWGATVFTSITPTYDSSFVIVGNIDGVVNKGALCMKVKSNGDTLWTKAFGTTGYERALAVEQTNDHGFIITGYVDLTANLFAAKLDSSGNLQWMNILSGGNNKNIGLSVRQTPDSGYLITGHVENYPPYDPNAFILKLTSAGMLSWSKKYNTLPQIYCSGNDIIVNNDGFICYINTDNGIAVLKSDFNGNIIWSKEYYSFINDQMKLYETSPKITRTNDNNYSFISGSCWGYSDLIKMDTLGNIIFAQDLFINAFNLSETGDKGFVIIGEGPMCAVKTPYQIMEMGIIKTDSLGNGVQCISANTTYTSDTNSIISSPFSFISSMVGSLISIHPQIDSTSFFYYQGCVSMGSGIKENFHENNISIFPNPTSDKLTITSSAQQKQTLITIFNMQGQQMLSAQFINQNTMQLDVSTLLKAIYIVKVQSEGGIVNKKLVIQ